MAKAIIWVRTSTTKQECISQRDELIKTAKEKYNFKESDLILIGKVGASAIKLNKVYEQEVNQLLEAIHNEKELSTIFVWEVSRLARNEKAFAAMKDEIIKNKIQLICNVPQIKLLDDNGEVNNGMELTLNLLITLAKQEMEIKKKRFARGKRKKAMEGKYSGGRIPFGYRAYPEKDNYIDTDEKEAEIVKMIYDMYESGYSQPRIAVELYERGYKNPRYKEPKIIQLGLVSNILKNNCYTGEQIKEKVVKVKIKDENKETIWTRYPRKFPQLITKEQYYRCRDIAKNNRTLIGKGKNIYYASKLVKCPSCGCYWSASGSKVEYHCYNAIKPSKLWAVDGRTSEQCNNKTSLSINILDSVLWYFAKREEAGFIVAASTEQIEGLKKSISEYQTKINVIPTQLDEVQAKMDKLVLRNVEGSLSDEGFEMHAALLHQEKSQLFNMKLAYQKKIEELEKSIRKIEKTMQEYGTKKTNTLWQDLWKEEPTEQTKRYNDIYNHICEITDDANRYEIIHRIIEDVRVESVNIKYKYKIGWRNTRAKRIEIYISNWEAALYEEGCMPQKRIYDVYYLPFNGRNNGLFIEKYPPYAIESFINRNDVSTGKGNNWDWLKDYNKYSEAEFEYSKRIEKVRIIDIPYLNRYVDEGKNKRRKEEKEKAYKQVNGYLRIEDVMELCSLKYNQIYSAIKKGELKALHIRHKCFISPKEAEVFASKVRKRNELIGQRITAFEVAKRYNLNYLTLLRQVKKGMIPYEQIDGHFYMRPTDVKEFFDKKR